MSFWKKLFNDRRLWFITIAVFILLITVFDRNNLIDGVRLRKRIQELESQKEYYQQRITSDSMIIENLKNDAFLEEYAREHYLMKKDGETVYVVED